MKNRIKLVSFIMVVLFFSFHFVQAVELQQDGKIIIPDKTSEPIKIDGDFSEKAWSNSAISKEFITFSPIFGEVLGHKTMVWTAYNHQDLYFAFKCYDTEPNKIKTSISRRDNISRDDWVGIAIDTMANKQSSYEFYVNPNGIQDDGITSAVNGWIFDSAPDFVWESVGKITDEGYQIEIRIPLESIRFKGGKEVKMGIIFMRNINRLGKMGSWPEIKAGLTQFNFMSTIIYRDLKKRLNLEVLPNFTYSRNVERENNESWGDSDISKNIGASLKYGLTSAITTEATIKPDFSQVESDAFQVEVNQRYPIFYTEKRPFFMEGTNAFDFGLINQGMMISAVYTRHIVDPGWAAKLSGTSGKMLFAVLAANDEAPGQPWDNGLNPYEGKDAFWSIARFKYSLGSDNSLGILYSGRHFAGGKNNVLGADLQYRFFKNARIALSYLYSGTSEPAEDQVRNGNGLNAMLRYSTRKLDAWAAYERYDENFTMYSAFLNRTNMSRGLVYLGPNFYMKTTRRSWLRKIQPYLQYSTLHDLGTRMDDTYWQLGVDMFFKRSGFLRIEYRDEKEAWLGQSFHKQFFYAFGRIQLFKWLDIQGYNRYGDQIYYHPQEPFLGSGHIITLGLRLQPNIKLNLNVEWVHNELNKKTAAINQKIYDVDILNLLATYQFNKYFFIRGVVRYNDFQKKLLTDFLASFTLIPGTVIHLGYGSLYENKQWQNNQRLTGEGRLLNTKNSLFFKVSYLWRIN
jgi:hypothetical protein